MNKPNNEELSEREIAALHQENVGPSYKRHAAIVDRILDAHIEAAMMPFEVCKFNNKYGFCKLPTNHLGSHTVVFLGDDDDWSEDYHIDDGRCP